MQSVWSNMQNAACTLFPSKAHPKFWNGSKNFSGKLQHSQSAIAVVNPRNNNRNYIRDASACNLAEGQISEVEVTKQFRKLVDELDLSESSRAQLHKLSSDKKRLMLCEKDVLQVHNASQKSPDAVHFISTLKTIAAGKHPSCHDETGDKNRDKCAEQLEKLAVCLRAQGSQFLLSFLEAGGIMHTSAALRETVTGCMDENCRVQQCVNLLNCFRSLLNCGHGRSAVIGHIDAIQSIVLATGICHPSVKLSAIRLLSGLCCTCDSAHGAVLHAFEFLHDQMPQASKFHLLVYDLWRPYNNETMLLKMRIAILGLINAILCQGQTKSDRKLRQHLRYQFEMAGLNAAIGCIQNWRDNDKTPLPAALIDHVDLYLMMKQEDELKLCRSIEQNTSLQDFVHAHDNDTGDERHQDECGYDKLGSEFGDDNGGLPSASLHRTQQKPPKNPGSSLDSSCWRSLDTLVSQFALYADGALEQMRSRPSANDNFNEQGTMIDVDASENEGYYCNIENGKVFGAEPFGTVPVEKLLDRLLTHADCQLAQRQLTQCHQLLARCQDELRQANGIIEQLKCRANNNGTDSVKSVSQCEVHSDTASSAPCDPNQGSEIEDNDNFFHENENGSTSRCGLVDHCDVTLSMDGGSDCQVPMRQLNWEKVPYRKIEGSIWCEIDESPFYESLDLDELQRHFANITKGTEMQVPTRHTLAQNTAQLEGFKNKSTNNNKFPKTSQTPDAETDYYASLQRRSLALSSYQLQDAAIFQQNGNNGGLICSPSMSCIGKISVIDARRAQNCQIVLSRVGKLNNEQICDAVSRMDCDGVLDRNLCAQVCIY